MKIEMKQLLSMVLISVTMYSCAPGIASKENDNLAIAEKYMLAAETMNVSTLDTLLAENYIGYGPSVGDSTNKKDALATFRYNSENLYESFEYTRHKELAVTVNDG